MDEVLQCKQQKDDNKVSSANELCCCDDKASAGSYLTRNLMIVVIRLKLKLGRSAVEIIK